MKKLTVLILTIAIILSFSGCDSSRVSIEIEDGTVYFNHSQFAPEIILLGDEDKIVGDEAFFGKLVNAINEKPINSIDSSYPCECDIEYKLKISADYKSGYYFLFHEHGIEIQQYCKYRKCLDLYGIVELDETKLREFFSMLEVIQ